MILADLLAASKTHTFDIFPTPFVDLGSGKKSFRICHPAWVRT